MSNERIPEHPIEPLFVDRWSPRAFGAEDMAKDDLLSMLEAARWAPSAYNIQPWRFVYALRGDANWQRFVDILNPFNATWAQNASALIVLLSDTQLPDDGSGEAKPRTPTALMSARPGRSWPCRLRRWAIAPMPCRVSNLRWRAKP